MVKVTWEGHSFFFIEAYGRHILLDPWIYGNPLSSIESIKDIHKVDYVFVSHDHSDHGLNEAIEICKEYNSPLVSVFELGNFASKAGVNVISGNIGGTIRRPDIEIFFTFAQHSSTLGHPCGFIIKIKDFVLYYTGDTGFFFDMAYYVRKYKIDLLIINLSQCYLMDIYDAQEVINIFKPQWVIPAHFNTFENNYIDLTTLLNKNKDTNIIIPSVAKSISLKK